MIVGALDGEGTNPEDIDIIIEVIETLLERYPAVALLLAIEHGTPKPAADERQRMQATLNRHGDRLVVGYAFCGLGFWASAIRTVLIGISRLAGTTVIAHDSVEATAQHIARELIGIDPEVMITMCEELRAELREDARLSCVGS